ncbi:MAG: hypothetical protein JO171_19630 [Paludibacterium sp.]|uniref:hypothetical protein n=1 Tax=Paludibacterium sp. TaxID=1917523 RepID=UPI0025CC67B3|nr:hypothetical protein [Paludibacterium sp.]MBV8049369.1 hypothetical protein [Paludibacterium sp.]
MAATLDLSRLIALHARLTRMRQTAPELLLAIGLDDWLLELDLLVEGLAREDIAA